ncbi:hypothetical protein EDD85DRAFT_783286 [Armillaria nabsnona]|nr:hypothetical protein EDD85DRAFT_783286 [Armillaria nabsnona]
MTKDGPETQPSTCYKLKIAVKPKSQLIYQHNVVLDFENKYVSISGVNIPAEIILINGLIHDAQCYRLWYPIPPTRDLEDTGRTVNPLPSGSAALIMVKTEFLASSDNNLPICYTKDTINPVPKPNISQQKGNSSIAVEPPILAPSNIEQQRSNLRDLISLWHSYTPMNDIKDELSTPQVENSGAHIPKANKSKGWVTEQYILDNIDHLHQHWHNDYQELLQGVPKGMLPWRIVNHEIPLQSRTGH